MPVIALIVILLISFRGEDDLHKFQQNSYRIKRYLKWRFGDYSRIVRPHELLFFIGLCLASFISAPWIKIVGLLMMLADTYFFWLIKTAYPVKKALVYTPRVKRLKGTKTLLLAALAVTSYYVPALLFPIGLTYFISFIYTFMAALINMPLEHYINEGYYKDAQNELAKAPHLNVLGITGSYGKTSTKNVINTMLSKDFNVLMTPESFNTKMGLTRTIRDFLKPIHQVFIAEMGAKEIGDIKELCDFVHPTMGIITSIGPQHLETFKTLENVIKTKGELFQAIPSGGTIFLNCDDENIMKLPVRDDVTLYRYAVSDKAHAPEDHHLNVYIKALKLGANGASFTLCYDTEKNGKGAIDLTTKLLGRHNLSNIVVACAVALHLGVKTSRLPALVSSLEPIEHRLSHRLIAGKYTLLDDAFNANPVGSKMALEVLAHYEGKKKIIITPGMIELGDQANDLNYAFGEAIAKVCDSVILVGPKLTMPIQQGLKAQNFPEKNCYIVKSIHEAYAILDDLAGEGDVVLIENDLPDAFNEALL